MFKSGRPQISVIIAAHNAETYLWETLASLQRQRFTSFEIILVDDGSTDQTRSIGDRPQCRVISIPRSGVSVARNVGLAAARGSAVLFLDADDVLPSDALAWLWDGLHTATTAPACVAQHLKFWTNGGEAPAIAFQRGAAMPTQDTLRSLLKRNFIVNGATILIRTEIARQSGGFNEKLKLGEDWDFWCRLALFGDFAILPDRIVLHYRQRTDGAQNRLRGTPLNINDEAVVSIFSHPHIRQRLSRHEIWLSCRLARQDAYWSEARAHMLRRNWLVFTSYLVFGLLRYPETLVRPQQIKRYWRGAEYALTALRQARR